MAGETLERWIDGLQSRGRYTFTRAEATGESGLSAEGVKKALQRLARRGRIAKVKDYFYVIVPLEYASAGAPPASWFVGDLMRTMELPYYVGLLSAAALHGASHQQPQEFHVFTDRSVRAARAGRTRLRFFASKYLQGAATVEMKTPTGSMRVAAPETVAVDLVRFAGPAGGLDNVATVIAELAPLLRPGRLTAALGVVNDVPNAQRLGYILDQLRQRRLAAAVHGWVERHKPRTMPLRPGATLGKGEKSKRWQLLVNTPLEIEA